MVMVEMTVNANGTRCRGAAICMKLNFATVDYVYMLPVNECDGSKYW